MVLKWNRLSWGNSALEKKHQDLKTFNSKFYKHSLPNQDLLTMRQNMISLQP